MITELCGRTILCSVCIVNLQINAIFLCSKMFEKLKERGEKLRQLEERARRFEEGARVFSQRVSGREFPPTPPEDFRKMAEEATRSC